MSNPEAARPLFLVAGEVAPSYEREAVARSGVRAAENRTAARHGDIVIPRYSVLPRPREFYADLQALGATPVNTLRQHRFLASLPDWFEVLQELTPRTWTRLEDAPDAPMVVKGGTNSLKWAWNEGMFARSWVEAIDVVTRILSYSYLGDQGLCFRQFVPLRSVQGMVHPNGLPISEEYRFFFVGEQVVASGFYWRDYLDYEGEEFHPREVPSGFLDEVASKRKAPMAQP